MISDGLTYIRVGYFIWGLIVFGLCVDAAAKETVVVVTDSEIVQRRVSEELSSQGFHAISYMGSFSLSSETIASEMNVSAVVRLDLETQTVDVWVSDTAKKRIISRRLNVGDETERAETVTVIAAVELLRACLLELHTPVPLKKKEGSTASELSSPKADPESPAPIDGTADVSLTPASEEKTARFMIGVGLGLATAGTKTGVSMRLPVFFALFVNRMIYFRLNGSLFLLGGKRRIPNGEIRFKPWLFGGEVGVYIGRKQLPVYPILGLGGGVSIIRVEGEGSGPLISRKRWLVSPALLGRVGLAVPITKRLVIQGATSVGGRLKIDTVSSVGEEWTKLGLPLVAFDLFLTVRL